MSAWSIGVLLFNKNYNHSRTGRHGYKLLYHRVEGRDVKISDVSKESAKVEISEVKGGYTIFHEVMRLIVNRLFCISSYLDDVEERWPDEAPQSLIEKASRASSKNEYKKANTARLSQGYTNVNYCGKSFINENVTTLVPGGEKSAHWRRGHWRNQAFGEGIVKGDRHGSCQ